MAVRLLLSARLGERRISQAKLARMTGIRPSTIGSYYNELVDSISLDHLELICEALKCDVSDLIQRQEELSRAVKNERLHT